MLITSTMYNKCNNEHYDIDISGKLIFCKERSTGYNLRKMAHRILFQVLVGLMVLSVVFLTALLKNGIVYQIILEKIIIIYNYS